MNTTAVSPHANKDRIAHLDVLRGFALLGILIMNIQSFAMPGSAYLNPMAWGNLEGINQVVWSISHVLADSKFMGLFSMLFGAGVCLFAERAEAKLGASARLHYRRNFWLLLFGLIHAHLIWYGDILFSYAMCAFWVYWFRNMSARKLFIFGILFISIASLYSLFVHFAMNNGFIPAEEVEGIRSFWNPVMADKLAEIAAYQGSYAEQTAMRSSEALFMQTRVFLTMFVWRAGGMMLLGMAFYKWGILSGKRPDSFYLKLLIICLPIGLAMSSWGTVNNMAAGFKMEYSMFFGNQFNYWGSILTTSGYIGLIVLLVNKRLLNGLMSRFAAVGQMAFTNYIMHSVICSLIFYGIGLGLFSELERIQQVYIVVGIWLLQLIISPIWLDNYRFGPLEWVWRSLTYWNKQPLSK